MAGCCEGNNLTLNSIKFEQSFDYQKILAFMKDSA